MGCTPSQLYPELCQSQETPELIQAYYDQNKGESKLEKFQDQSDNVNIGLINYKSDEESFISNMGEEFHYTDLLEIAILLIMILLIIRFLRKRCQQKRAMAIRSTLLGDLSPKSPDQSLNNAFPMMQYPVPTAPSTIVTLPQATLAPGQFLTSLEMERQPKRQLELSRVYNS